MAQWGLVPSTWNGIYAAGGKILGQDFHHCPLRSASFVAEEEQGGNLHSLPGIGFKKNSHKKRSENQGEDHLRVTPAMQAGIFDIKWNIENLL